MLYLIALLLSAFAYAEKVYVVERERGAVAVVENDKLKGEVKNLGNLNHATLKFLGSKAFVVSRDGFLSSVDTDKDSLMGKVKVGDSTIGFTFCEGKIVVANYSPHTVVFLSPELEILREIDTGSRNVGIKSYKNLLTFALMDRDQVWVLDCKDYRKVKVFENVGNMPFDALLSGESYLVGFFKESSVGVANLKDLTYRKVSFRAEKGEVVFKIPHFGLWGVYGKKAYIPAVGERRVHIVNLESFEYEGSIELPGLPVFVSVSPDGKYVAVNYSGDMEDYLTLINRGEGKVIRTEKLGKRILHFRFTSDGKFIYLSSYYENRLKKVSVPELKVLGEVNVPTPSGVFIKGG
ncbi:protein NirF [Hydrogenivirga caldilitoris]|uniref:Protein NirF n=1 Tax=Hydrogenivirga caldilitoris TaxID=246264 RepID=A0A497XRC7_9AQUI|nr:cytochrome D1 domain-containing protein [Hydrogenivirga caldilitoris]RLJ70841.1 protein NirF [Hydrogenivirga caldilitoris]